MTEIKLTFKNNEELREQLRVIQKLLDKNIDVNQRNIEKYFSEDIFNKVKGRLLVDWLNKDELQIILKKIRDAYETILIHSEIESISQEGCAIIINCKNPGAMIGQDGVNVRRVQGMLGIKIIVC